MIATVREENISSWKVIEKVGFILDRRRMRLLFSGGEMFGMRNVEEHFGKRQNLTQIFLE